MNLLDVYTYEPHLSIENLIHGEIYTMVLVDGRRFIFSFDPDQRNHESTDEIHICMATRPGSSLLFVQKSGNGYAYMCWCPLKYINYITISKKATYGINKSL